MIKENQLKAINEIIKQGKYESLDEFIEEAIANQLMLVEVEETEDEKLDYFNGLIAGMMVNGYVRGMGHVKITQEQVEDMERLNKKLDIHLIGQLTIADDVSAELLMTVVKKIKVVGKICARDEILLALKDGRI